MARGEADRANDDAKPALLGGEDVLATAAHRLHPDPRREPPLMALLALSSALRTGSSMCPIGLVARFAICFADGRVQRRSQVSGVFGIALGPVLQAGNTRRDATFDRILCNI